MVTTSPTASDPSTHDLMLTSLSIKGLFDCPLIYGADGVRPEQRDLTARYEEKLDTLRGVCDGDDDMCVLRLPAWGHQANVLRMLLAEVTTPLVLVLEHDTPLTPDVEIDWQTAAECILSRELDSIRFLHESAPLAEHAHLFIDRATEPQYFGTMPYVRTVQWSQRPHLAHTQWYRWLLDTYFSRSSRAFVEDVMHSVVVNAWNALGMEGWEHFRLAVYADPVPTMQRSFHLDGRAGGDKYEQVWAYPEMGWPEFAPCPTLQRVFE